MLQICEKNQCTGCLACVDICSKECITVTMDEEGFFRPVIDNATCIDCGACTKKCPANNELSQRNNVADLEAFSFVHPSEENLMNSASGGAFVRLAEYVIKQGGVVFGACYNSDYSVSMRAAFTQEELLPMCGSKYVECKAEDSYKQVKQLLDAGKTVLFTSTPCRIAGLYSTLGNKNYDNLYTAELVCHGVPSTKLFNEYLEYLTKKYGEITSYSFRDKSKWGWGSWGSFSYKTKNGTEKKKHFVVANDYYYSLFFKENTLRESCYVCKYASLPRCGDVVLGDFWGIDSVDAERAKAVGVSLIITTNEKGKRLVGDACGEDLRKTDFDASIKHNQTVIKPTKRPQSRDSFYKAFNELGFLRAAQKYCKLRHVIPVISRYIPKDLKSKVKKLIS